MAEIVQYAALTAARSDDVLPIVDVHDTSMSPQGTSKRITVAGLLAIPPSADTTGATDTAVINAALTAAPLGGVVALQPGTFYINAPLVVPPQVTLVGSGAWHLDTSTCEIIAVAAFSGAALILMYDQSTGGYSVPSNSQSIQKLILNGAALSGSIDGIQSQGFVHGVILQDVQIYKAPAHGIACVTNGSGVAYSWRGTRVSANTCGTHGFSLAITDCTWYDLEAIGCAQNGFNLSGSPANSHFTDCRAEYNLNGFALSGAWATGTGSGGVIFTGCSTDGNVQNGVSLAATGSVPVTFDGLMCRRDGANGTSGGGSFAGVKAAGHTLPTTINGLSVFPGVALGGGANSPEYGVAFTGSSANITVGDGAVLYAATTPWFDDASNTGISRGANVLERIGTPASFSSALYGLQASHTDVTFTSPAGAVTDLLAPAGSWLPSDAGFLAWNFDPLLATTGSAPSNNTVVLIRVNVRAALSVTNVCYWVTTLGSGLTASQNYAGLFNSAGTLIAASADQSASWTSTGLKTSALAGGPYNLTAGFYWVALLANESAGAVPQFLRIATPDASTTYNAGLTVSQARCATNGTGTSLSNITPASNVEAGQVWWAALS